MRCWPGWERSNAGLQGPGAVHTGSVRCVRLRSALATRTCAQAAATKGDTPGLARDAPPVAAAGRACGLCVLGAGLLGLQGRTGHTSAPERDSSQG